MKQILFCEKVYSRWLILLIDQLIVSFALGLSLLIISRVGYQWVFNSDLLLCLVVYNVVTMTVFIVMRIHTGIIRYSNVADVFRVFKAVLLANLAFGTVSYLGASSYLGLEWPWFMVMLLVNFFISASVLIAMRIGVKLLFYELKALSMTNREVLVIFGADASALLIKHGLTASPEKNFKLLGFIDDNPDRTNKYIEQKKVYHSSCIATLKEKYGVEKMIVLEDCSDIEGRKRAVEQCMACGIRVISVPASRHWLKGNLRLSQLPDLKIEDLLQREQILLDAAHIIADLQGKRVLITGAAGSIGSEIVRQVMKCAPEMVLLCDQAESPLHELQLEMSDHFPGISCSAVMLNIQNSGRVKCVFEHYKPQIVFHAAALKHVPLMEDHPSEAILTNVLGTKNLADMAVDIGVEKFVMISTDKAVRPTNVMGASKRIAEMYIQSLQNQQSASNGTRFITTRFGNVLGSNGSVVPRFKSQIAAGGPVTVTDPEITRYFMTIPEAVQLVLEASVMGNGGEIFIFDMGEPVKIADLAINMIRLAGYMPHTDIKIVYSGLRPGEKLFEELLNQRELVIPTYHEKIKISKVIDYPYLYVLRQVEELFVMNAMNDDHALVKKMKEIIPDYISANSPYVEMDVVC
ncbi:capsular polysaccharide biosynthesis protein CapD [Pedobacter sp. BAL39]|uniref:polysaccharide biosynthesis protein n=1 Tax=Pedobacter sp. BAL39 TaxID=391596 RepID=UPI0001559B98|nr:nucleoside-diphosphate sugar epimerase/dehydratase [Pedobacter sp. BAL39]EDM38349.1 capsular polysaccharide biosynthesis protein CapD [Pedobacter sp. BAL39]